MELLVPGLAIHLVSLCDHHITTTSRYCLRLVGLGGFFDGSCSVVSYLCRLDSAGTSWKGAWFVGFDFPEVIYA